MSFFPISAHSDYAKTAEETAVSKVIVGLVQSKKVTGSSSENWKKRAPELHGFIVKNLNDKSYLLSRTEAYNIPISGAREQFAKLAARFEVDGVFSFEARPDDVRVVLRSGKTGRPLGTWTFPYKEPLSPTEFAHLMEDISNSIIGDFPYVGVIKKVTSDNATINLGRQFRTEPGTILQVFEFDDSNPNFSSQKAILGKVLVTKVDEQSAVAKVSRTSSNIHSYAKLQPYVKTKNVNQDFSYRNFDTFWLGVGPQFLLLDTTSSNEIEVTQRRYRFTLTPFYKVNAGYGPLMVQAVFGRAQMESTQVNYTSYSTTYDVFLFDLGSNIKTYTGVGANYSSFSSKSTSVPAIISSDHYSFYLDQALSYRVGKNTRFFVGGQLIFPTVATDSINGGSQIATSYGVAAYGGLRVQVTTEWAFEGSVFNKLTSWNYSGKNVQEVMFSSSFGAIYLF